MDIIAYKCRPISFLVDEFAYHFTKTLVGDHLVLNGHFSET